ncbi:50S ribosomal protein L6 [Marinifilum flexuosum]|jgi:large subunit ribosomal protein L6|uniref:Large ribosomal subunit protein uL6 n=1 Tax=Marinifilum flexuosum TaxID=1117708 RepID=A0A419X7P3_9BACT|nr:50S ribosomal protein L6 [Marinifilum flexuosum]RKE03715.1 large subunit ribosomal protein L6 [Marinifilum flexuosum]
MSRIGKLPINLPAGVSVTVNKDNSVVVKGPKGELTQQIDAEIKVSVEEGKIVLERPSDQKRHKAMHGLYRSLMNNMVIGVTEGYKIEQELVGVGYRATSKGQLLELALGYSHLIHMEIAPEVKVTAVTEKRANPIITLESCDKHLVGQVAAKIRSFRKPEPYKGKGIKFVGEQLRRKAGKSAGK